MVAVTGRAGRIPRDVAAAIKRCFPDGSVQEFATDESYFHAIHASVQRDLRNIRGAWLVWETENAEDLGGWGDENDEPPSEEWQSYHVFFLAPVGEAFHFEDETEVLDEAVEAEGDAVSEERPETIPGEGWIGCAVGISKAARYAVINLDCCSRYEDGTVRTPDVESFIYSDRTHERVDTLQHHCETLSPVAFQTLTALNGRIASILRKRRIRVLDESVLNLYVPGLEASTEVFLEAPLRVRDALFFRGI